MAVVKRDHGWHSVTLMGKKTASGYLFDAVTSPGWATGFFQTESLKDRRKEQEQQSQKKRSLEKGEAMEICFMKVLRIVLKEVNI